MLCFGRFTDFGLDCLLVFIWFRLLFCFWDNCCVLLLVLSCFVSCLILLLLVDFGFGYVVCVVRIGGWIVLVYLDLTVD